jgi:TP901 family phage tail tape measure protein
MGLAFVAVGAAAGAAFGKLTGTGASFEDTLIFATSTMDRSVKVGTSRFKRIETQVRELARITEFTGTQVAETFTTLAQGGLSNEASIFAAIPRVLDFATANRLDLRESADIGLKLVGALNLPRKSADELGDSLQRVNNILTATSKTSLATVPDMFEALKQGSQLFREMQLSPEEVGAFAGVLAGSGIIGTRAETTMKNIATSLAAPTPKGAKVLRRLGVETVENGQFRNIGDILKDLNAAMAKEKLTDRVGLLVSLFQKIPVAGASGAVRNFEEFGEILEKVEKDVATNAVFGFAANQRKSALNRIRMLGSALEDVKLRIFTGLVEPLKVATQQATAWVNALDTAKITDILGGILNNFGRFLEILVKIGKTIGVLIGVAVALKTIAGVMAVVNTLILANPIGAIVVALLALIGVLATVNIWWEELVTWLKDANFLVKLLFVPLLTLAAIFKLIADVVSFLFKKLMEFGGFLGELLKPIDDFINKTLGLDALFDALGAKSDRTAPSLPASSAAENSKLDIRVGAEEGATVAIDEAALANGIKLLNSASF